MDGKALYGWERGYRQFVAGKVWLFGMDPDACPALLEHYGWWVVEHVGDDELAVKYIGPTGRRLASTPIERMVYAQKLYGRTQENKGARRRVYVHAPEHMISIRRAVADDAPKIGAVFDAAVRKEWTFRARSPADVLSRPAG